MADLGNFYQRFCKEGFDKDGVLNFFEPIVPENFNFAYDVVDEIASVQTDFRDKPLKPQVMEKVEYTED